MYNKYFKINKHKFLLHIVLLICCTIILFACNYNQKDSNLATNSISASNEIINNNTTTSYKDDCKYYDIFNISPVEIIVPKNQTVAQGLSVLVNDGKGNLIVFDGGRVEDADYLSDIIKDNGWVVKTWYITHIHDDHIGALYKILSDKRTDIVIKELYYDFANFDWYYEKMGNDAGIYTLFDNAIRDYNVYMKSINKAELKVLEKAAIDYRDKENDESNNIVDVTVLNNVYAIDQDPINNTSIVYLVSIMNNKVNMLILGDLGYGGGEKFFNDVENQFEFWLKKKLYGSDIIVLAHHGQNGIDPKLYKRFTPSVIIWPTSEDIYLNSHGRYYTNDTKKVLSEIDTIEYQIKSYEETAIIR